MKVHLEIEVVTLEPIPAVVLGRRVRRSFEETTVEGIQRVRKAVTAARVPTAGPPFVRYPSRSSRPEIEIGLPLDGPHVVPTLRTTILPGGEGASLWHTGPTTEMPDALEVLRRWVENHGRPAGNPWEWYWTEPDAEELRVQLVWPAELR